MKKLKADPIIEEPAVEGKTIEGLTEIPPSLTYELNFADSNTKQEVLQRMQTMRRQTMNLRLMPDAQLIVLRDMEKNASIIGWAGMALKFNPKYPEVFSLTLMPEYQKYLLGLYLEYSRSIYLLSHGYEKVFMRITNDPTSKIRNKRLKEGFVTELDPKSLDSDYTALCQQCELYGKECQDRLYVQVNLKKIVDFAYRRLGPMENIFPNKINLDVNIIRKKKKLR